MEALSPHESREVEALAAQYPEIQAEMEQIQNALSEYVLLHAREPRPELKQQILDKVSPPMLAEAAPKGQRLRLFLLLLAFLGIVIMGFFIYKWRNTEQQLQRVVAENESLKVLNRNAAEQLAFLENPQTRTVVLENPKFPDSKAVVYWNKVQSATLMTIKGLQEPKPGKQYQLWAIVNGNPKSAGVVTNNSSKLQQMKDITDADAFAITLEPAGGSPAPTSDILIIGAI